MRTRFVPSWATLLWLATTFSLALALSSEAQVKPLATGISPPSGGLIPELKTLNVIFNVSVKGVEASDLLINGAAATAITTNNPNDFTFTFPQPADGVVTVEWIPGHGITDTSDPGLTFDGGSWTYTLDSHLALDAKFIISEFLTDNIHINFDDEGNRSDWIELSNRGTQPAALDGWFLTDTETNLTKWRFPLGMSPIQPNGYLLVWASGRDHTNPVVPLHTNFKLSSSSNFLALVDPNTNIISAFAPYPQQLPDTSYGRDRIDPSIVGYFTTPTPGKTNTTSGVGFTVPPLLSADSGVFTNDSITVSMSAPEAVIRYTLNGSLPLTNSQVYTGALTLKASSIIKARAFPPAGSTLFPSPIVARHYIFLDTSTRDFNSDLPVLIVSTAGQPVLADVAAGQKRTEGSFAVFDTVQGRSSIRSAPDFLGATGIEVVGQTSAGFSKLPYRLEIHDEFLNDLSIPLLGMPSESDWKLRNPFDDKTLMNDFLGYELFEKLGHYSCRRRMVEVFVDSGGGRLKYPDDYVGVEALFETIKQGKSRVDIAQLTVTSTNEPAVTGGYIFKKDKDSTGDLNFTTSGGGSTGFPGEALKMHEPKPNEFRITPGVDKFTPSGSNQFNYLVKYLNRMEKALYATNWLSLTGTNHYSYYLDTDSFVDFHLLVEFTKQIDGIRLSSYFTKDRNGKVQAGPIWDWNLSFGNANYLRGGWTNGWYYAEQDQGMGANEQIWLRRLVNGSANMGAVLPDLSGNAPGPGGDPDFNQKVSDRWSVVRTNVLNGTNVLRRIDELAALLSEPATRDLWGKYKAEVVGNYLWPNPDGTGDGRDVDYVRPLNYVGTQANSIIGQMKKWVLGRYLWIDSQFTQKPTLSATGGQVSSGFSLTVTPPAGTVLYFTLDGTDPRLPGGKVASNVISNTGVATIVVTNNVRVFARAYTTNSWYQTWSGPSVESFLLTTPDVRITEIMYHPQSPAAGNTNAADAFEFIEVKNIGTTSVDLARYHLGGGVDFVFPSLVLAAGQRAVVVADTNAFRTRYPDPSIVVAGQYTGNLSNSGDQVTLTGALGETIHTFSFQDSWYPSTDGPGFALVPRNEDGALSTWNSRTGWRAGGSLDGTPGKPESVISTLPAVVINEATTHSESPAVDEIELFNPTSASADVTGWYLTDDSKTPKKYRLPAGSTIAAGGYLVVGEKKYSAGSAGFTLSAKGEEVYLFSADAAGNLTGYSHGFQFGAQLPGVSFGRVVTQDGEEAFVTQRTPTLGSANSGPKVGPIVISEVMYHPTDVFKYAVHYDNDQDEYIELRNITATPVSLFDTTHPTNTWQLRDAVGFTFPMGSVVPAQGVVLVVGFDPSNAATLAAFQSRYGIPGNVTVYGPWSGRLANGGANVELTQPDAPIAAPATDAGFVPEVMVDRLAYKDTAPWPASADGLGASLHRKALEIYGDDVSNWYAATPTPGASVSGSTAPVITQQPQDVTVVSTNNAVAVFSVTASGAEPLTYQWLYNGETIPGATGPQLVVQNPTFAQGGLYEVAVFGPGGTSRSQQARLTAITPLIILTQPTSVGVKPGLSTTLTVTAASQSTISYQWYLNGVAIPGANSNTYKITSAKLSDDGIYQAVLVDAVSTVATDPIRLPVLVSPVILVQPLGQVVSKGGSAIVSVVVSNTATFPLGYRWRKNLSTTVGFQSTNSLVSFFVLTNITADTTLSVTVTNYSNKAGLSSAAALIKVAIDTDNDGLPDDYEALYPAFLSANDSTDADKDYDGDGMSNLAEYIAGTDPSDPASYLKVSGILGEPVTLTFQTQTNRSYTVQFTDQIGVGLWQKLADLPARPDARLETVIDPSPTTNRAYRLVTPYQP